MLQVQPPERHSLDASPWGAEPPHWGPSLAWSLSCYPSLQEGRGRATRESLCPLPATWKPWLSHWPPKGKDWPQGRKAGARWWQECVGGADSTKPLLPCPMAEVPPAQPGVLQAGPTRPQQDGLFLPSALNPNSNSCKMPFKTKQKSPTFNFEITQAYRKISKILQKTPVYLSPKCPKHSHYATFVLPCSFSHSPHFPRWLFESQLQT